LLESEATTARIRPQWAAIASRSHLINGF
jgi:hypothetical protein